MAKYSIKKRHGLDLLNGFVLSVKARVVCVDNKEHRRCPDPNQVNARRVLNQIVASNVIGINQSSASAFPVLPSITSLVQRTSNDANACIPSRNSLASFFLPIENTLSHR
ncbi:hypothetical protein RF11_15985 [Thelohanellus kitauei]|uniref:Uncharacterized protein n=1 Tax=Thelohanellus kitauei TaxID=669202 RepID=A0A0C2MHA4_THEKT|nr:hypothetical protein RF11_15985 [Thelohanellus kitauei]